MVRQIRHRRIRHGVERTDTPKEIEQTFGLRDISLKVTRLPADGYDFMTALFKRPLHGRSDRSGSNNDGLHQAFLQVGTETIGRRLASTRDGG